MVRVEKIHNHNPQIYNKSSLLQLRCLLVETMILSRCIRVEEKAHKMQPSVG